MIANNGKVILSALARMQIALLMTVLNFAVLVPAEEQTSVEELRTVEDVQGRVRKVEERTRKNDLSADKTEEKSENLQKRLSEVVASSYESQLGGADHPASSRARLASRVSFHTSS